MMFMKQDMDDFGEKNAGGFGSMRSFQQSPAQQYVPGLEKMCKMFIENHQRIEKMLGGSQHLSSPNKYG